MKYIKINPELFKNLDFKVTVPTIECSCGETVLDTPTNRLQSLNNMTTTNERFIEEFIDEPYLYENNTGWTGLGQNLLDFIQQEISLAKEEERKRIVEMIREYAEPYDNAKWLNEVNAQKIITLITNNK